MSPRFIYVVAILFPTVVGQGEPQLSRDPTQHPSLGTHCHLLALG